MYFTEGGGAGDKEMFADLGKAGFKAGKNRGAMEWPDDGFLPAATYLGDYNDDDFNPRGNIQSSYAH